MSAGGFGAAGSVEIVELVEVCARERARSMSLFEHVGAWVATTDDPALQRLFATAAHRHAWHAQLWAERAPTIPVKAVAVPIPACADCHGDTERWAEYATALGQLQVDLGDLRERVDADLDPATARLIALVGADVADLASALATLPGH